MIQCRHRRWCDCILLSYTPLPVIAFPEIARRVAKSLLGEGHSVSQTGYCHQGRVLTRRTSSVSTYQEIPGPDEGGGPTNGPGMPVLGVKPARRPGT